MRGLQDSETQADVGEFIDRVLGGEAIQAFPLLARRAARTPDSANTFIESARVERAMAQGDLYEQCHNELFSEFIGAMTEPSKRIQVPGFNAQRWTLQEVINDSFAGSSGDEFLTQMIRIVGLVAAGQPQQVEALNLIGDMATKHADFHADDLLEARQ